MTGTHPQIVLDIDPTIDPIGGRLSTNGSTQRPFSGWIALAREIEDALIAARRPSSDAPQPTTHQRATTAYTMPENKSNT